MSELTYRRLPVATSLGHFEDLRGKINQGDLPACNLDSVATTALLGQESVGCFFNKSGTFRKRDTKVIEEVRASLEVALGSIYYQGGNMDSRKTKFGWHDDHNGQNDWDLHLQGKVFGKEFRRTRFAYSIVMRSGLYVPKASLDPSTVKDKIAYTGKTSLGWSTYFRESGLYREGDFWYNTHYFTGGGLWTYFRGVIKEDT